MPKTFFLRMLLCLSVPVPTAVAAPAAENPVPPAAFAQLMPRTFDNGLRLVGIRQRCADCDPWRTVEFRSNGSAEVRRERVSVAAGITAMYAFPGTGYFANVKIEQSLPGHYEQDKAIVIDALRHDCARKKDFVGAYVASHPETRGKLDVELDSGSYQGYEYAVCAENVAGMSGTLGQVQIFLPHGEMIVTAYLLNQKDAQLKTAEAVLAARRAFIEGYIGFLAGGSR